MSGLLGGIFSAGDRMKRKLGGLLTNPLENVALGITRVGEDVNRMGELASEAGYILGDRSVLVSPQQNALARALLAQQGADMGSNMIGATVRHGTSRRFDVRPPKESLREVADANFMFGVPSGSKTMQINNLRGSMSSAADDAAKVSELAKKISSPDGYIERLIVDQRGNVLEGQHRLNALRSLGVKDVPVSVINDYTPTFDMLRSKGVRPEHARNIIDHTSEMLRGAKSAEAVRAQYVFPKGYESLFNDALNHMVGNGAPIK